MKKTLLHLGAEGGDVSITSIKKDETAEVFQVTVSDMFAGEDQMESFTTKDLAWKYFQDRVPSWTMLYPLAISADVRPLVQKVFEKSEKMNEYTHEKWKHHFNICAYSSKSLPDIVSYINTHAEAIINRLEHESFETYLYIRENYKATITDNYFFQFVFRSFYRLDGGGLSPEIKQTFFNLFEEFKKTDLRENWDQALTEIVERIYLIPSLKSQNTVQFSFATKLLNTLNDRIPIYDSEVKAVFGFAEFTSADYQKRLARLLIYHKTITEAYNEILNYGLLQQTIEQLDFKYPMYAHIPAIKKLDFLFWSAGKGLRKAAKN